MCNKDLFTGFLQEPECELGADAAHSLGSGGRAGAEPRALLRVLHDCPLERRPPSILQRHQQHPALRSQEGEVRRPQSCISVLFSIFKNNNKTKLEPRAALYKKSKVSVSRQHSRALKAVSERLQSEGWIVSFYLWKVESEMGCKRRSDKSWEASAWRDL